MPSGDFAGVDAVATPAAAAALASAAGDSGGGGGSRRGHKTPFTSSRPSAAAADVDAAAAALCAHENGAPLSVPRIRNTPSRTTSLSAAVAATISLRNPEDDDAEPELRQWNMNIVPEPEAAEAAPPAAAAAKDAALPRRGRGQKRKA